MIAGEKGAALFPFLNDLIKTELLSKDNFIRLSAPKILLLNEVYLPEKFRQTQYPNCSYVVFMPLPDLVDYVGNLKRLMIKSDASNYERRFALYSTMSEFLKEPIAFPDISDEACKKMSYNSDFRDSRISLRHKPLRQILLYFHPAH